MILFNRLYRRAVWIHFFLFYTFQSRSLHTKKKERFKNKMNKRKSYLVFQALTWTTHFFILPYHKWLTTAGFSIVSTNWTISLSMLLTEQAYFPLSACHLSASIIKSNILHNADEPMFMKCPWLNTRWMQKAKRTVVSNRVPTASGKPWKWLKKFHAWKSHGIWKIMRKIMEFWHVMAFRCQY